MTADPRMRLVVSGAGHWVHVDVLPPNTRLQLHMMLTRSEAAELVDALATALQSVPPGWSEQELPLT